MTKDEAIHSLFDALISVAKDLHKNHERLLPFGAALHDDLEIRLAAATPPDPDAPDSEYETALVEGFQSARTQLVAVGWAVDLRIDRHGVQTDALRLNLEHRDGDVACLYVPYSRNGGACGYGEPFRVETEPRVFGKQTHR